MRTLNGLGYRLAVVTNQDVMGWGVISNRELRTVHDAMFRAFRAAKVRVENVYYCRHHLFEDCPCRKPRAGLLLAACKDLGVCPRDAWMVGDKVGDVLAGKAIGSRTVFVGDAVRRRKFAEELAAGKPDISVPSLAAFARALQRGTVPTPNRPALT
jgi:D-glycero-D-manno-heptose 1,7-bisphosphate phosphatase